MKEERDGEIGWEELQTTAGFQERLDLGQWGLADPMCLLEESGVVKACPSSRIPIMLGILQEPGLSLHCVGSKNMIVKGCPSAVTL